MSLLSRPIILWPLILAVMLALVLTIKTEQPLKLSYNEFLDKLYDNEITEVIIETDGLKGVLNDDTPFATTLLPDASNVVVEDLKEYNEAHSDQAVDFQMRATEKWWMNPIATMILPVVVIVILWLFLMRQLQMGGSKAMSFGKTRAKLHSDQSGEKITFDDVAGAEEPKEELQEIVEFLKEPEKFRRLGGKIPKGVMLFGAPGTGKTLLAKAVAGEAGVPFFSISGSDFVEMFVGVGAARVRDLFETGKKNAPCIIFIDEIDAVGRHRFAGWGGGHDEREQTLNQLLVELDGFTPNDNVILVAATNRPDVLDPALLRPGRFDRRIVVDLPDHKGREQILEVHTKTLTLGKDVDLELIARRTPGFSGADLANAANEAALLAARKSKDEIQLIDFEEAIERVYAGPERRSRVISDAEKKIIAYHESGHALLASLLEEVDPLHKVSIVSRGQAALGYTLQVPEEDKHLVSKKELLGRMTVIMGGRVAEEVIFGEITTGAHNDLEKVTDLAHRMVTDFGMSDAIGPVAFGHGDRPVFVGKDFARERLYSEAIAFEIDKEVKRLIQECHDRAENLLREHRPELEEIANVLLEKEVMEGSEVDQLLKKEDTETEEIAREPEAENELAVDSPQDTASDAEEVQEEPPAHPEVPPPAPAPA